MHIIKHLPKKCKKYCVVVRIGDPSKSLHKTWTDDNQTRTWDIIGSFYSKPIFSVISEFDAIVYQTGHKWPAIHNLYKSGWFEKYDYIWFADYDIATTCNDINNLFAICDVMKLSLAQPSLTHDSFFSHEITRTVPNTFLRFTRFVEMMMPVFSQSSLSICADEMQHCAIGWGMDHVWPKLLGYPERGIAIIDSITMKHTQPIGGNYSINAAFEEKQRWFEKYEVSEDWTINHSLTF